MHESGNGEITLYYMAIQRRFIFLIVLLLIAANVVVYMRVFKSDGNREGITVPPADTLEMPADNAVLGAYIVRQADECGEGEADLSRRQCLSGLASELTGTYAFAGIIGALEQTKGQFDCHNLMHYIVHDEYVKGMSLPDIYIHCTDVCFGACWHGGLEGYFADHDLSGAGDEAIARSMLELCSSAPKEPSQCYHGLGHALMLVTQGELPRALSLCDSPSESGFRQQCFGGVFMENSPATTSVTDHPSKYTKADDPLYPCNAIDEHYQETCYSFQTSYFAYLANSDWKKVGEYCALVPDRYQRGCYQSIGISAHQIVYDFAYMKTTCELLPHGNPRTFCFEGVIVSFQDRYPTDTQKLSEAKNFCPLLDTQYKKPCYEKVAQVFNLRGISVEEFQSP